MAGKQTYQAKNHEICALKGQNSTTVPALYTVHCSDCTVLYTVPVRCRIHPTVFLTMGHVFYLVLDASYTLPHFRHVFYLVFDASDTLPHFSDTCFTWCSMHHVKAPAKDGSERLS